MLRVGEVKFQGAKTSRPLLTMEHLLAFSSIFHVAVTLSHVMVGWSTEQVYSGHFYIIPNIGALLEPEFHKARIQ